MSDLDDKVAEAEANRIKQRELADILAVLWDARPAAAKVVQDRLDHLGKRIDVLNDLSEKDSERWLRVETQLDDVRKWFDFGMDIEVTSEEFIREYIDYDDLVGIVWAICKTVKPGAVTD